MRVARTPSSAFPALGGAEPALSDRRESNGPSGLQPQSLSICHPERSATEREPAAADERVKERATEGPAFRETRNEKPETRNQVLQYPFAESHLQSTTHRRLRHHRWWHPGRGHGVLRRARRTEMRGAGEAAGAVHAHHAGFHRRLSRPIR